MTPACPSAQAGTSIPLLNRFPVTLDDTEDVAPSRQPGPRAGSAEQHRFSAWIPQFRRELLHFMIC